MTLQVCGVAAVAEIRYQPCYCEENVWFLCQDERVNPASAQVVIVTNWLRGVRMWSQRATFPRPVVWDYHVFVWSSPYVWDLDTLLGFPVPDELYFRRSFWSPALPGDAVGTVHTTGAVQNGDSPLDGADFAPEFRLVAASDYVRKFGSDRSHMMDDADRFLSPPPPWPPLSAGTVPLMDWLDLGNLSLGRWIGLSELLDVVKLQRTAGFDVEAVGSK